MTQTRLDWTNDVLLPRDSHVTQPEELSRLSGQNALILARLQKGPASNVELSALSLKYTSRISDLRKAGYVIECQRFTQGGAVYRLVTDK